MADRRMFSKRIINSGRFLKMPISTQALYFHLGLNADDDGIVEAYNVISSINGCTEDDLKVLVSKGFVEVLNDDLVTYITDWTENNKIRADRKIDSIYKDLLISINPSVKLLEKRPRADVKPKIVDMDNQWTSNGQPMDGIGEDRIGKDSKGKDNNKTSNKSDELDLSFDRIYENYPKKVGKSRAKQIYKALLTKGRKIDGKTVKFTHEDICAGLNVYYNDKTEPNNGEIGDTKYWMNFDTLMNRIQDYVERREELDE